jgi:phosphohistidine phosphatase SixA
MLRSILALLLVGLLAQPATAQQTPADLGAALRAGGLVIVFRHGATNPDQADTDPLNHDNVARQRHLSDAGRTAAARLGDDLKRAGVTIGTAYSSKFQRAVDTARLVAGKDPIATLDVTEGGLVVSPNENNRRAAALRAMAGTAPAPGTDTLIVTHKPNIIDAFGKDWFEVKEAEASIFRPSGDGKYVIVSRLQISQWTDALR